jgi:regulatory protein
MLARKGYSQGLSYSMIREELQEFGAESTILDEAFGD